MIVACAGFAFFALCFYGLNRLLLLMDDEGTESWTVNAGPFGVVGCVIFLGILLCFSIWLINHAVYLLAPRLRPLTRAEF